MKDDEKIYVQFSIRVKYKGPKEEREYKYGLDYVYVIDGVIDGVPNRLVLYSKQYLGEDNEEVSEIKKLLDSYKQ